MRSAVVYFDAVELIDITEYQRINIELVADAVAPDGFYYFQFQQAQFTVGDDQKISAAAGGVKKLSLDRC